VILSFSATATADELRQVQTILAASPGTQPVRLLLNRGDGGVVRMEAKFGVTMTEELREKLGPWLPGQVLAS
jgi:hypothetical protein